MTPAQHRKRQRTLAARAMSLKQITPAEMNDVVLGCHCIEAAYLRWASGFLFYEDPLDGREPKQ